MNYYIKQKVFSWKDKFNIYDEQGNPRYYVEGEFLTIGKKLHLQDMNGNELLFIHQKVLSFLMRYYISKNGRDVAEVVKKISFLKPKYEVNGFEWDVEGDFFAHSYEIKKDGFTVARVQKRWLSWGDTYEISIASGYDEVNVLAVVLVIDACLAAQNSST